MPHPRCLTHAAGCDRRGKPQLTGSGYQATSPQHAYRPVPTPTNCAACAVQPLRFASSVAACLTLRHLTGRSDAGMHGGCGCRGFVNLVVVVVVFVVVLKRRAQRKATQPLTEANARNPAGPALWPCYDYKQAHRKGPRCCRAPQLPRQSCEHATRSKPETQPHSIHRYTQETHRVPLNRGALPTGRAVWRQCSPPHHTTRWQTQRLGGARPPASGLQLPPRAAPAVGWSA